MEIWNWKGAIFLVFIFCAAEAYAGVSPEACGLISAGDSILISPETCSVLDVWKVGGEFVGVIQGDETALQRAASIVEARKDQYVAVLFYASWCPFSKTCLPNFNSMASLFPTIPHFAFEESVIRPSILSRYGVHGFPTLFLLHSSSMRVRHHGSRSTASLTAFYSNVTGIKPSSADKTTTNQAIYLTNLTEEKAEPEQENCPFSWAKSPEKFLQQDTYLVLASSFLMLRLLHLLLPKLICSALSLWKYSRVFLHQHSKRGFFIKRLNPCSRSFWLVAMFIGEPSGREREVILLSALR